MVEGFGQHRVHTTALQPCCSSLLQNPFYRFVGRYGTMIMGTHLLTSAFTSVCFGVPQDDKGYEASSLLFGLEFSETAGDTQPF